MVCSPDNGNVRQNLIHLHHGASNAASPQGPTYVNL